MKNSSLFMFLAFTLVVVGLINNAVAIYISILTNDFGLVIRLVSLVASIAIIHEISKFALSDFNIAKKEFHNEHNILGFVWLYTIMSYIIGYFMSDIIVNFSTVSFLEIAEVIVLILASALYFTISRSKNCMVNIFSTSDGLRHSISNAIQGKESNYEEKGIVFAKISNKLPKK